MDIALSSDSGYQILVSFDLDGIDDLCIMFQVSQLLQVSTL